MPENMTETRSAKIVDQELRKAFAALAPHYEQVVDNELFTFWGLQYDGFIEMLLERTPIEKDDRVLDLATGTAALPRKLLGSKYPACQIVGLDITLNMLYSAKQKIGDHAHAISLTCASAVAIPFESGSFDVITCGLASHHIEVNGLLCEIKRVLKKGGAVTIADVSVRPFVRWPIIKPFLEAATFLYFLSKGSDRALAEARAIANVHAIEEWFRLMTKFGFENIRLEQLPSKYRWIPAPFVLTARAESRGDPCQ